jgi:hypothetical protein
MTTSLRILGAAALAAWLAPAVFSDEPPAARIAARMADVTDDLNKTQTGKPVQVKQKTIVHDLDELIASLEKQCQNCRGGIKRNDPTQGMRDSTISAGTGGIGTLLNPADNAKDWARLSERERDRILQSMSEGFPPEYRTVLERYYRRLADEKGSAAAKAPATGADAKTAADQP